MEKLDEQRIKRIAKKIKELRVNAGYGSYVAFAIENDLGRNYYFEAEKGRNMSLLYLFKLLKVHNVAVSDFFKDID